MGENKKTALIRDLNKCLVFELGSDGKQPTLTDGRNEAIAAFVWHDGEFQRVYNRGEYTLEVFELNFEFEASEQDISHYVGSYKRDYNPYTGGFDIEGGDVPFSGVYSIGDKEYTFDESYIIPANNGEEERSGYINILQPKSGLLIECKYTQLARQVAGYSFWQIEEPVYVNYEEVDENGGSSYPYVKVTVWLYKHYTDGTTDEKPERRSYSSISEGNSPAVRVTYASGLKKAYDATIDEYTGVVSVGENTSGEEAGRNVFEVQYLQGNVTIQLGENNQTVRDWRWRGSYMVTQQPKFEDYPIIDSIDYNPSVDIPETMLATDEYVRIFYRSQKEVKYHMASNPSNILTEYVDETLYVAVNGVVSATQLKDGYGGEDVYVGKNSNTTDRTITLRIYNSDRDYDETFTLLQYASDVLEYWTKPVLNGRVVVEDIGADGRSSVVLVPIIQYKYRYNEVTQSEERVDTYATSVVAVGIGGKAENNVGYSFANGEVSASSMGTTEYLEGRLVFTMNSVTVDGIDYPGVTLNLGYTVEIRQAANIRHDEFVDYVLSVSAYPTRGISNLGGTSTISYSAQGRRAVWYDSAPDDVSYDDGYVSASLSASEGTIASSVYGEGTTTLTLGENWRGEKDVVVTLSADWASASCSVTQDSVVYEFHGVEDVECNGTETLVYVQFVSRRNGRLYEPRFSVDTSKARVDSIAQDGNVYTVGVVVFHNNTGSARDIAVTATQARWDVDATESVIITQAAAAVPSLPKAGVVLDYCMYDDTSHSTVSYALRFSAKSTSQYNGGTLEGVSIQFRDAAGASGNMIDSPRNLGDLTIARGLESSTYSGTFNSKGQEGYLHVYWDNKLQFSSQAEENPDMPFSLKKTNQ